MKQKALPEHGRIKTTWYMNIEVNTNVLLSYRRSCSSCDHCCIRHRCFYCRGRHCSLHASWSLPLFCRSRRRRVFVFVVVIVVVNFAVAFVAGIIGDVIIILYFVVVILCCFRSRHQCCCCCYQCCLHHRHMSSSSSLRRRRRCRR